MYKINMHLVIGRMNCRTGVWRLLVFLCLVLTVACQSESRLALNSTVFFQNMTLLSPGGVFEVGLAAGAQPNRYTLAIWYAQPALQTVVVWVADRAMALDSVNGTSLTLSAQGDLQLYDNGASNLLWTSNTTHLNVTSAAIEDTGNLVLLNKGNQVVWQSFDSPTDTLLPNQTFSNKATLTAWQSEGDWSEGRYALQWNTNSSNLMAFWQNPYKWYSSPNSTYWSPPVPSGSSFAYAVLTSDGAFRAVANQGSNSTSIIAPAVAGSGRLLRLTLDPDGNIRIYSWSAGSANWTAEWTAVDVCSVSGHCGPYGICQDGQCRCPRGFQVLDATDARQGCTRTKPVASCGNASAETGTDTFGPADYVDWGFVADWGFVSDWGDNPDLSYIINVDVPTCMERCLGLCDCQAVVTTLPGDGNNSAVTCWLKQAPMLNGTVDANRQCFFRIAGSIVAPSPGSGSPQLSVSRRTFAIAASAVGAGAAVLALLSCFFGSVYFVRKMQEHRQRRLHDKWVGAKGAMLRFTYREIKLTTNNFDVEIGKGGFGSVFKGQIVGRHDQSPSSARGGVTAVAVKRLNKELSHQVEKEFLNEVNTIGLIHHVNLVSLLGYCSEADHRLLVYEYVEKGSLDALLFNRGGEKGAGSTSPVLEWRPRLAIAIHTARGLAYLHEDCDQQIIHCDIKPENILLDAMLAAKVADFGISRIMQRDQTRTVTMHVRGTRGYLAPEYWASDCVSITNKVDVFSYGMVLLEIVSGRRNLMSFDSSNGDASAVADLLFFPTWAFPKIETEAFMEVVDPALAGIVNPEEVRRVLQVAFWCINGKPHMRPSMSEVVQMLQGHVPIKLPVPRPDYFDNNLGFGSNDERLSGSQSWLTSGSNQINNYSNSTDLSNSRHGVR